MQVTREDISDTKVKLTVEVGLEELTHAKQSELQDLAKGMKVTGFRKGKAPLTVVEKQVDQNQLQANVINHAINDAYGRALESEKLRTLGQPEVQIGKFVPYDSLEFTAEVEILPPVKLADYKKIKKQPEKVNVTAKDVDEVLSNLREKSAEKKAVKRAAKNGDEVIIDFEGIDTKGEKVAGANGKDYGLTLGSNSFIPGFEEGLVGLKAGEKKDLKLTFPTEYHAENLAGSKITFAVDVKEIKEVTLPKVDDKFAAKLGPFKTAEELKADIKGQLKQQKELEATNVVKDIIIEELVKKSKFTIPEVLVEDQENALQQDFVQNLMYRGMTKEEYLKQQGFKDEADWIKQEIKPQAERRVSVGLVLAAVADAENLSVSDEELASETALRREQYSQQAAQFDTPEMQRELASRLLTEKTINLLFGLATKK